MVNCNIHIDNKLSRNGICKKCYQKKYLKKYYQNNKEKLDKVNKEWVNDNHNRRLQIQQKWRCDNDYDKEYYKSNKENIDKRNKEWRDNHEDYYKNYNKKYRKEHPEKKLESDKKSLDKLLTKSNYPHIKGTLELESAYRSWANSVKKRDDYECVICGGEGKIAHHLFHKSKYPNISLNVENGITLCNSCHGEYHTINGFK